MASGNIHENRRKILLQLCILLLLGGIAAEAFFLFRAQPFPAAEPSASSSAQVEPLSSALPAEEAMPSEEDRQRERDLVHLASADAYAAAEDTSAAIAVYRLISETDSALFAEAQEKLAACEMQYRRFVLDAAGQALSAADYASAKALLQTALTLLPNDADLCLQLAKTEAQHLAAQQLDAMRAARIYFDSGDYSAAFAALEGIPDALRGNTDVQHTLESYRQMYLLRLPAETENLLREEGLEAASAHVAEAERLFPDAAETAALRTRLNQYQPVLLASLPAAEFADFFSAEASLKDSSGTEYSAAEGNLFYSYDGSLTGRKNSSAVFQTDGRYTRLKLTAVPLESFAEGNTVFLEISGDGKLLETYALTQETAPLYIQLDITGVQMLRLRVRPFGAEDLRNAGVLFVDGMVSSGLN